MKLASIFTDNAVFAAGKPIRIFGCGKGLAKIEFCGITHEVISEDEKWCITLPEMKYGGPYTLKFTSEGVEKILTNIHIGEVYLFSGQSNIGFRLSDSNTPRDEWEEIESLMLLEVGFYSFGYGWRRAKSGVFENFSALGYLVGKEISKKKGVAVGIIQCSQGASIIESWLPEGTLEKIGISIPTEDKHDDHIEEEYEDWNKDAVLYEKKLKEVIPYSLSGVVWYQGESDASEAEGLVYERELSELIRIWREKFLDTSLPFTVVQLADTHERMAEGKGWELIQKAQASISKSVPGVYTAISRDVCETDDVHPKTKKILAERIASIILKNYL